MIGSQEPLRGSSAPMGSWALSRKNSLGQLPPKTRGSKKVRYWRVTFAKIQFSISFPQINWSLKVSSLKSKMMMILSLGKEDQMSSLISTKKLRKSKKFARNATTPTLFWKTSARNASTNSPKLVLREFHRDKATAWILTIILSTFGSHYNPVMIFLDKILLIR